MASFLPPEILRLIFLKLPIKSVMICSFVCKYWESLIKDPIFFTTTLNNNLLSILNDYRNKQLLLVPSESNNQQHEDSSIYLDRNKSLEVYMKMLNPPLKSRGVTHEYGWLGTADGVVCLLDFMDYAVDSYCHPYILWNPFIQKHFIIPTLQMLDGYKADKVMVGFGFDRYNNDYKLLRFLREVDYDGETEVLINVFSIKNSCWKMVTHFLAEDLELNWCRSLDSVNGVVYCFGFRQLSERSKYPEVEMDYLPVLLIYDLAEEKSYEFDLPWTFQQHNRPSPLSTRVYKDSSITVFISDEFYCKMWVTKENGEFKLWRKQRENI